VGIAPNNKQLTLFRKAAGIARFAYNWGLDDKKHRYQNLEGDEKYTNAIKQHREINKITGDEEIVRAYILTRLVNELGYNPENIELEKKYPSGRPKVTNPRIDIIVKDDKGNPFFFIELKSPNDYEKNKDQNIDDQLFSLSGIEQSKYGTKVKYLVYYTIEIIGNSIKDKCIIIDYEEFSSFDYWKEVRNFTNELPEKYNSITPNQYKFFETCYLDVAKELNLFGSSLQAICWICYKDLKQKNTYKEVEIAPF